LLNLILLFPDDFNGDKNHVRLQGRRLQHVLTVHHASVGDSLCVGKAGERIGTGTITRLSETVLEMAVQFDRQPPSPLPLTLLLALPRPKVLKRVLRSVSALGVKRIVLLNSFRVEKSYWQSPVLRRESLQEELVAGLEQAKDTVLPEMLLRPFFKPFVEDELPGLAAGTLAFVAHPTAAKDCPRSIQKAATLAIGPEGGFIPYEIDKFIQQGFTPVQTGNRILNVETAVPAIISRLY